MSTSEVIADITSKIHESIRKLHQIVAAGVEGVDVDRWQQPPRWSLDVDPSNEIPLDWWQQPTNKLAKRRRELDAADLDRKMSQDEQNEWQLLRFVASNPEQQQINQWVSKWGSDGMRGVVMIPVYGPKRHAASPIQTPAKTETTETNTTETNTTETNTTETNTTETDEMHSQAM